jgi:anionic cell wall polymer biosynthesis LytR-Cps2A-Psr (LCP) family protein
MFVRSRHGRSDWSRARRQQRVLLGLRDKLDTVDGLLSVPGLLAQFEASLRTDLSRLELLQLARRALHQNVSKIHGVVLDTRQVQPFRNDKNWSVLLPNREAIAERLASVFTASAPGTEPKGAVCAAPDAALRTRPRPRP